jgi:hypothetical protein
MVATHEVARARSASNQASELARGGATPPSSAKGPSACPLGVAAVDRTDLENKIRADRLFWSQG